MKKSSINIQPVKGTSERHNEREPTAKLDYVRSDLQNNNVSWKGDSISNVRNEIAIKYQESVGQKMQDKATPIREGVFLFDEHHTLDDAKQLAKQIEQRFNIKTFQIHMHRDEGRWVDKEDITIETKTPEIRPTKDAIWKPNLHGHLLFNWTDEKGKSIKMNRKDMAELQTITASSLSMERGKSSDKKHLDPLQFKTESRRIELEELVKSRAEEIIVKSGFLKSINEKETQQRIEDLLLYVRRLETEFQKLKRAGERERALLRRYQEDENALVKRIHSAAAKYVKEGDPNIFVQLFKPAIEAALQNQQVNLKKQQNNRGKGDENMRGI